MAKAMTKSEIAGKLADEVGISKKQVNQFFESLSKLAYKEAKNAFVLPGLGKMVMVQRAAREMKLTVGPNAGQTKKIPAKKVLKFRFAKAAKDAVLGAKK
jgi:DNA-binding protein HU-beta